MKERAIKEEYSFFPFLNRVVISDYFNALISGSSSGKHLKQAVANLMYLCHILLSKTTTIQDQVLQSLEVLHSLPPKERERMHEKISYALRIILRQNAPLIRFNIKKRFQHTLFLTLIFSGENGWKIIFSFLHPLPSKAVNTINIEIFTSLIENKAIFKTNAMQVANLLFEYAKKEGDYATSTEAIKQLSLLISSLPSVLGFKSQTKQDISPQMQAEAWDNYWQSILFNLSELWNDPRPQVRHAAVIALQESVLYLSDLSGLQYASLFEKVCWNFFSFHLLIQKM